MKTVSDAIQSSKHYEIGDLGIELIDVIKAKLPPGAYQWFLWASAEQYSFRLMNKGCHLEDLKKRDTYAKWLREDIEERGMRMDMETREWRSAVIQETEDLVDNTTILQGVYSDDENIVLIHPPLIRKTT